MRSQIHAYMSLISVVYREQYPKKEGTNVYQML